MRAVWNGVVIAEGDTVVVGCNHYFALDAVRGCALAPSRTVSLCPWKGVARYHDVAVNERSLTDGAWYYPQPWPWVRRIKGRVAFWGGVVVEPVPDPGDG